MSKRFLIAALFALTAGTLISAQAAYKAPRTPWGDPDLSGVYSNDDETGTPLERPAQFEGRRQEDITPAELKKINQERTEQFNAGVAGTEFAGGLRPPTHLIFDSFERKNSRVWLVTDPPDGRIPPLTPEGQQRLRRPQRGVSTSGNANNDDGRDHWPYCYTACIAGAGIKRGVVYGKSDGTASAPIENPVHPIELLATIYHSIGINPATIVYNHLNQPRELVKAEVVGKLFA